MIFVLLTGYVKEEITSSSSKLLGIFKLQI